MTEPSYSQQAEYNKFMGFYSELHEFIDSLATEYNSIVTMHGPFTFTDEMRLDIEEACVVLTDLKAKLHKVFLVNGIEQAGIDQRKWAEELAVLTKGVGAEGDSDMFSAFEAEPECVCDDRPAWGVIDCPRHGVISHG